MHCKVTCIGGPCCIPYAGSPPYPAGWYGAACCPYCCACWYAIASYCCGGCPYGIAAEYSGCCCWAAIAGWKSCCIGCGCACRDVQTSSMQALQLLWLVYFDDMPKGSLHDICKHPVREVEVATRARRRLRQRQAPVGASVNPDPSTESNCRPILTLALAGHAVTSACWAVAWTSPFGAALPPC